MITAVATAVFVTVSSAAPSQSPYTTPGQLLWGMIGGTFNSYVAVPSSYPTTPTADVQLNGGFGSLLSADKQSQTMYLSTGHRNFD
jgi:hypothetical protein